MRSMLAALAAVAALLSIANAQEEKGAAPGSGAPAAAEVGANADTTASGAPEVGADGMPDATSALRTLMARDRETRRAVDGSSGLPGA